ncbi:MAG: MucR family transcriptional regulator [Desulfatibacillaceae bacterium]|nr:MucR family transcriptional regulator [Desulfatibacillaceae bacterium]
MHRPLVEKAVQIVAEQAAKNPMTPAQISVALKKVYQELAKNYSQGLPEDCELETNADAGGPLEAEKSKRVLVSRPAAPPKPSEPPESLDRKFETLTYLRRNPNRSIKKDVIICLECGGNFQLLGNHHLKTHNLDKKRYLAKWSLAPETSLACEAYSDARSRAIAQSWARRGEDEQEEKAPIDPFAHEPAPEKPKFEPKIIRRKKSSS